MRGFNLWSDEDLAFFRDFDRLQGSVNQLFGDFGRKAQSKALASSHFSPACDIQETKGHYVMNLDLPGLKKEDIRIQIEDNQLRIWGERKEESNFEDSVGRRIERSYGRFERVFALPSSVESEKIEAHYENGVLSLVLPKIEAAKARQIKVTEGRSNLLDRVFGKKPELKTANES